MSILFGRDSVWVSSDGRSTRVRDLDDIHLVNIIRFLETYGRQDDVIYETMIGEVKIRGIKDKMLDRAFIPYKKDGKWMLYNSNFNEDEVVG